MQQAESEETAEEEKVEDVASSEEPPDAAGEESLCHPLVHLRHLPDLVLLAAVAAAAAVCRRQALFRREQRLYLQLVIGCHWTARQEYKNASQYITSSPYTTSSTIHPYTLIGVNYAYGMGLSGKAKL